MNLYEHLSEVFQGSSLAPFPVYEVKDEAALDDAFFKMLSGMSKASLRALRKYSETPEFRWAADSIGAQMDSDTANKNTIANVLRNL